MFGFHLTDKLFPKLFPSISGGKLEGHHSTVNPEFCHLYGLKSPLKHHNFVFISCRQSFFRHCCCEMVNISLRNNKWVSLSVTYTSAGVAPSSRIKGRFIGAAAVPVSPIPHYIIDSAVSAEPQAAGMHVCGRNQLCTTPS